MVSKLTPLRFADNAAGDLDAAIVRGLQYIDDEWAIHNWSGVRSELYGKTAIKGWGVSPDAFVQVMRASKL